MLALALLCMAPERVSALENRQIVSIFTENQTALRDYLSGIISAADSYK